MKNKNLKMTWEEAVLWLKAQEDKAELIRNCYFDDPIESSAARFHQGVEWQKTKNLLPKMLGKVLDLGAGRGQSSYALAKDGWAVTSLDPDPSHVVGTGAIRELAKRTGIDIEIIDAKGEALPFAADSFDLVYTRQALHHSEDLYKLLKEIYRVCRPGGTFIAVREHVVDSERDKELFLESHPLHEVYDQENAYLLIEYLKAITEAGFILSKTLNPLETPINYYPLTRDDIVRSLLRKISGIEISVKINQLFPDILLKIAGDYFLKTPGRLYTFVAQKI